MINQDGEESNMVFKLNVKDQIFFSDVQYTS